jgi:diadenosine tetraphosphatase ApaH/serine/threonine PP2A family protein phosphatase
VKLALLADIHSNREALEAVLAHAREHGAERFLLLGDYVGYGADPEWVVGKIMDLVEKGAVAILGNHDAAVKTGGAGMDSPARTVIEWTRGQLGAEHRAFLAGLPLTWEEEGRLFLHSEAVAPQKWTYVTDAQDAGRSLRSTSCRVTFCAHVHKPAIFSMTDMMSAVWEMWKTTAFCPVAGVPVPLLPQRRWLAVIGSVGQPRDGDPSASYAILDSSRNELTYHRVPYDFDAAGEKIRAAGLPWMLADRLRKGL